MIEIYLADSPRHVKSIREAFDARDMKRLAEAAHALKSGSGSVGALLVYKLCGELETIAGRGDAAGAGKIVGQLETEYLRVEKALRK